MPRSSPRPVRAIVALALVIAPFAVACGVQQQDDVAVSVPGGGGGTPTTEAAPPCTTPDGGAGGAVGGGGGDDADCTPTTADPATTTTEHEATTTTTSVDEGGTDEQAYVDALVPAILDDSDIGLPIEDDQARCIATSWVDTLGADRLDEAGVTPDDLDGGTVDVLADLIERPEAEDLVTAIGDCDVDISQAFVDGLAAGGSLSDDQATCIVDKLPAGYVDKVLAITLAEGVDALDAEPGLADPLQDAAAACPAD